MGMSRTQKTQEVENLKAQFEEEEIVVVAHYSGLTVGQMTKLRAKLRDEGAMRLHLIGSKERLLAGSKRPV